MSYQIGSKTFTLKKVSYKKRKDISEATGGTMEWIGDFEKMKSVLALMLNEDVSVITEDDIDENDVLEIYTDFFSPKGEMLKRLQEYNQLLPK
jgi:hypothetical protein